MILESDDPGAAHDSQNRALEITLLLTLPAAGISLEEKQQCLEMNDAVERLRFIRPQLRSIRQEVSQ